MNYDYWRDTYAKPWLNEQGRLCAWCGASNTPLDVDHIVPRSNRKDLVQKLYNVWYLCALKCHRLKSDRPRSEWPKEYRILQEDAEQTVLDLARRELCPK